MRLSILWQSLLTAALLSSVSQPASAQMDVGKRPIDYFDQVEITFTADNVKMIGEGAEGMTVPSDTVEGRLVIFIPKIKEDAQGFWETDAVRFSSMSIKTGEYSFPMTRVSASIQFIDDRPMRLVIGRAPGGRDAILQGSQDFILSLTRASRSRNDYQLEFSNFAYALFGKKGVEFFAGDGRAEVKVKKEEDVKKNAPVDFGFSIGSYRPDSQ